MFGGNASLRPFLQYVDAALSTGLLEASAGLTCGANGRKLLRLNIAGELHLLKQKVPD